LILSALLLSATVAEEIRAGGQNYLRQELRLNEFSGSAQARVALARDEDGGLLAAWDSRRQEEGSYGVYARRLDERGLGLSEEFAVNLYRLSHQMRPAVLLDEAGAWMVWESWGQDGDRQAVLGRAGDSGERLLSERVAGSQEQPVAASLGEGRRLAIWVTPGDAPGSTKLAGRLFDARGEALGAEFAISPVSGARDRVPSVAAAGNGDFVVAWTRELTDGSLAGILARRFHRDGSARGEEFFVAAGGFEPSLDVAPGGAFAVAWQQPDGQHTRARARLYSAHGDPLDGSFELSPELSGWQSGCAVAWGSDERLAFAWNQVSAGGEDADIHALLMDAEGRRLGSPFRVNEHTEGWQGLATASGSRRLAMADDGTLAVAWDGDSGQGDASAANLTMLRPMPERLGARLLMRGRLALASLANRLSRRPSSAAPAIATPYQPPVFDPENIDAGVETEPYFPGSSERDEGWTAITNTGWTPPDPHMAAGPNHLMATVNGGLAAFDKSGTQLWFDDISGSGGFWGSEGATWFVFDPEVIYDPHADRFIAMANERGTDNHSYFLIGVSASSDPTGVWYKYRLDVTSISDNDIDSPNIAVDEQAIYLTADFFGPDKYLVYIIDKSSVLGGGSAVTTHHLMTGRQSLGIPVMYDTAPPMYMIWAPESYSSSQIYLYAIMDPLGSPYLVDTTLSVPTYWQPADARSYGTSAVVETFEARFWSCVYRDGSLWACHHIRPYSGANETVSRWYEIEMNGWPDSGTPSLRQSGEEQPNGTGYATFNSITVNQWGDAAMCYAYSSTNDRYSMVRSARMATDPLGTMGDPVFLKTSDFTYSGNRWGDYSAAVVDPSDWTKFWMIHEYATGSGSWNTWIANFTVDLTGLPPVASAWPARVREAFPNPSRGDTHLGFALPRAASVSLEIYDLRGRLVRRLEQGRIDTGSHELVWDGRDEAGRDVVAGQYMSLLVVDGEKMPGHRITLLR